MLNVKFFQGQTAFTALIIAGVHGSEISGIEVANWINVKLTRLVAAKKIPWYTTIVVPEIFPVQAALARSIRIKDKFGKEENDDSTARLINGKIEPNRQFPKPGFPLSSLGATAPGGGQVLPENRDLLGLIEQFKPDRLATIHAHSIPAGKPQKGVDWPGIFVDPRYEFDETKLEIWPDKMGRSDKKDWFYDANGLKFNREADPAFVKSPYGKGDKQMITALTEQGKDDDALAFTMAGALAAVNASLVPGNFLKTQPPVIHYSGSTSPNFKGFSMGDWGPVLVDRQDPGNRVACPVYTIEVYKYFESWAFINGEQYFDERGKPIPNKQRPKVPGGKSDYPFYKNRADDLQAYADVLINEFLMKA